MIITEELLESFKVNHGNFTTGTRLILRKIAGTKKGWTKKIIGKNISDIAIKAIRDNIQRSKKEHLEKCQNRQLAKKERKEKRSQDRSKKWTKRTDIGYDGDVNSLEFLSSYEWRTVRMIALKREGAICACCGASPKTGAVMNVDHIKPRRTHPHLALDPENLQVLCDACNHGKGNWDDTDWRKKPDNVVILRKASR